MNKLKRQMWAKCVAFLLAVVTGLSTLLFGTGALMVGLVPEFQTDEAGYEKLFYGPILETYAASLWENIRQADNPDQMELDGLDGGNIRYVVESQSQYYLDEPQDTYTKLYANDSSVNEENCMLSQDFDPGSDHYLYNTSSFAWAMRGPRNVGGDYWNGAYNSVDGVDNVLYDEARQRFFFYMKDEYFVVPNFDLVRYTTEERSDWEDRRHYELQRKDGVEGYYDTDSGELLTEKEIAEWMDSSCYVLVFFDMWTSFKKTADEKQIQVGSWDFWENASVIRYYEGSAYYMNYTLVEDTNPVTYRIRLTVCENPAEGLTLENGCRDYIVDARELAHVCYRFSRTWGWYVAGSLVLFLLSFVFLMSAAGWRKEDDTIQLRWIDRVPYGVYLGVDVLAVIGMLCLAVLATDEGISYNEVSLGLLVAFDIVAAVLSAVVVLLFCMSTAVRIKAKSFWKYTLCGWCLKPFRWLVRALRENTKLYVKAGLVYLGVNFVECIIIASMGFGADIVMECFFLYRLVQLPLLIYLIWQLNRLWEGGRRIASGDYSRPIPTKGMMWDFKKHAENLNNVSSGISIAVEERMKSERFRTELITNVSHDIKTPLTSIINYVDLIKKEGVTDPVLQEYVEVLDRQSLRLKKLIEDLMEASKASTGNLSVNLEVCDATVMLSQVVGEFAGRAEANNLELVVDCPEPPVTIMADGRHLWRVLDNLMSNVCKYAMPGTRVYINLEVFHGMVIMTFRNISKSPLNISSDELMERFVRGDSSRNTEGSGLGLNIAQSLTSLMNGNMAIQIDGDLFKAIVSFPQYIE